MRLQSPSRRACPCPHCPTNTDPCNSSNIGSCQHHRNCPQGIQADLLPGPAQALPNLSYSGDRAPSSPILQRCRSSSLPWVMPEGTAGHHFRFVDVRERRVSFVDLVEVPDSAGPSTRRNSLRRDSATSTTTCWYWDPTLEKESDTVDFALETSLHGLKYICQPKRHICERIFWLLAFLTGMTMAGWLISEVWTDYLNTPLVVTFEPFETTIDSIPFPAITICNMNKVQKSKAEEYVRLAQGPDHDKETIEARKNIYYLDHVCSSSKSFSQMFNYSVTRGHVDPMILNRTSVEDGDDEQRDVARFLQNASQPCTEMLLLCAWQDTTFNCSDLFKPVETDFGKCCTFNMIPHHLLYKNFPNDRMYDAKEISAWSKWDIVKNGLLLGHKHYDPTNPPLFPRRQNRAGKSSGLSVLLNPDLQEYFCTSSDSHGFQLVKHLPIDVPKVVDFGIAIKPNSEVFMGIRPEITAVDRDIYTFSLEKRNCYYFGEFSLAYYNIYTSSNCYDECLANQTYEECRCVSYYMPRDDTRDLCGASNFQCAEHVRKRALQSGIKSGCDFCLPSCTELEYFSETTFTPIQKEEIWVKKGPNTSWKESGVPAPWANKNLSIVHIYFSSDSSYARVRKELYGVTDLIANTGGLMGLCLGFSGLSLIEVIYFYTLRAWCRSRRAKNPKRPRPSWGRFGLGRMWRNEEKNANNHNALKLRSKAAGYLSSNGNGNGNNSHSLKSVLKLSRNGGGNSRQLPSERNHIALQMDFNHPGANEPLDDISINGRRRSRPFYYTRTMTGFSDSHCCNCSCNCNTRKASENGCRRCSQFT